MGEPAIAPDATQPCDFREIVLSSVAIQKTGTVLVLPASKSPSQFHADSAL